MAKMPQTIDVQWVLLVISIAASFLIGRMSVNKAAEGLVRTHAKKACRRIVSMYRTTQTSAASLAFWSNHLQALAKSTNSAIDIRHVVAVMESLQEQLRAQYLNIEDLVEDWRDIAPLEIAALERQYSGVEKDDSK